jgi:hypothetical protein
LRQEPDDTTTAAGGSAKQHLRRRPAEVGAALAVGDLDKLGQSLDAVVDLGDAGAGLLVFNVVVGIDVRGGGDA